MRSIATRGRIVTAMLVLATCATSNGAEPKTDDKPIDFANLKIPGMIYTPIGVTRQGTPIPAFITADDLDLQTKKARILFVGGLDGSRAAVEGLLRFLEQFQTAERFARARTSVALSAVLCGNPDGYRAGTGYANQSGGEPGRAFPPPKDAYASTAVPEAQYLWRWIDMHAPTEVVLWLAESAEPRPNDESLKQALRVPSSEWQQEATTWRLNISSESAERWQMLDLVRSYRHPVPPTPHQAALEQRAARSPREAAAEVARHYGQKLPTVQYIPALALVGRLRLGAMTNDPSHRADVEKIVAPYLSGEKPALTPKSAGSEFAGHLIFAELFQTAQPSDPNKDAYLRLVKAVADLAFDKDGTPRPSMPAHSEMSDAVFMSCPILAAAGRMTGDTKYYDACLRHLRFMQKLVLRKDGIYRHSPLDEAAWGRGNGFPALGLAWTLSYWPESQPGRDEILKSLQAHLAALLPYQDVTGCWHQVIDHPESYREFTCTAMITLALARGVREGWLPRERFSPAIERGWQAVKLRIGDDGTLVDVCTGTGKQPNLRAYYDRLAILGRDDRGGAMALMVATEMMAYEGKPSP